MQSSSALKAHERGQFSVERESMMSNATKRAILRWSHIVLGIPIAGYIYSPFKEIPNYAPPVRFVFFPILVLMGLWMWKGHLVRRLFSKKAAGHVGALPPCRFAS